MLRLIELWILTQVTPEQRFTTRLETKESQINYLFISGGFLGLWS